MKRSAWPGVDAGERRPRALRTRTRSAVPRTGAGVIAQAQAGGETDALIEDGTVSAVAAYLQQLYLRHLPDEDGEVATYIPELAHVDPSLFGICLATVDGAVYEAGDTRVPFTIQSMSKPLTYGLALERLGRDAVRSRIGVEPSGDAFNELSLSSQTQEAAEPVDQRGGDDVRRTRRGRCGRPVRAVARDLLALRGPRPRARRGGLPLRGGDRAPEPGHGPHPARVRGARRAGGRARPVLPPVLDLGRVP